MTLSSVNARREMKRRHYLEYDLIYQWLKIGLTALNTDDSFNGKKRIYNKAESRALTKICNKYDAEYALLLKESR